MEEVFSNDRVCSWSNFPRGPDPKAAAASGAGGRVVRDPEADEAPARTHSPQNEKMRTIKAVVDRKRSSRRKSG